MNFTIIEEDSNITIAVITSLMNKPHQSKLEKVVAKAVKEEWGYESVEVEDFQQTSEEPQRYTISFDCVTPDGDEEIRAFKLDRIAVYPIYSNLDL